MYECIYTYVFVYIFDAQHREALFLQREEVHMYYLYTIHIYIHAYIHTYIHNAYIHIHNTLTIYIYIYTYVFDEIYICTFIYIHKCIYAYTYTYIIFCLCVPQAAAHELALAFFFPSSVFLFLFDVFFFACFAAGGSARASIGAGERASAQQKRGGA
jgi:hypothetical protein